MNEVVWIIILGIPVVGIWISVIYSIIFNFRKKRVQAISIKELKKIDPEYFEYGESSAEIDLQDED